MIKFFRRIRQKLLTENRFSKYLLYAIGEIILVVIGILIALSINNWNESKKTKEIEHKLLGELKNDLLETKKDLLTDVEKSSDILTFTDSLYQKAIKKDWDQMKISMSYIYETPHLFAKLSAYKSIQAYGVNIISNDSLRKMITNFYELHLERVSYSEQLIKDLNEKEIKPHLDNISIPVNHCKDCSSLFELYGGANNLFKEIYQIRKADTKIIHLLKEKFKLIDGLLHIRYKETEMRIEEIIQKISMETEK